MTHRGLDQGPFEEDVELIPAEDQTILDALTSRLVRPGPEGPALSQAAALALETAIPPEPLTPSLRARLGRIALEAEADLAYQAHLSASRRSATLANYVAFLRERSGLSSTEAAKRTRIDLKWLTALERNLLRPQQVPAARLASLLRALHGSLAQAEELLVTTIRAPRWLPASGRDSLFRGGAGARGIRSSPPDPERENPEYFEELAAVQDLREALRRSWRG